MFKLSQEGRWILSGLFFISDRRALCDWIFSNICFVNESHRIRWQLRSSTGKMSPQNDCEFFCVCVLLAQSVKLSVSEPTPLSSFQWAFGSVWEHFWLSPWREGGMLLPFAEVGEGEKMSSMRKSCPIPKCQKGPFWEILFPSQAIWRCFYAIYIQV